MCKVQFRKNAVRSQSKEYREKWENERKKRSGSMSTKANRSRSTRRETGV
jgi:hypothetical protein